MPCLGPTEKQIAEYERARGRNALPPHEMPAALCCILTVLENSGVLKNTLDLADWAEAGVRREDLEWWWGKHKREDDARRKAPE